MELPSHTLKTLDKPGPSSHFPYKRRAATPALPQSSGSCFVLCHVSGSQIPSPWGAPSRPGLSHVEATGHVKWNEKFNSSITLITFQGLNSCMWQVLLSWAVCIQTTYHYHRTLFLLLIFFGVQLIYTIILVSAIQHSASVIHRHTGCVVCCVKSLQSCPTLCDPMDHSPPGSSIHGILQARIPEWVAMLSSRGSSQPKDQTCISYTSCIGRWVLYH